MMAVLPELAIMRPVSLNRAREPHLSQQELKGLINALGQFFEALSNICSYQTPPSHSLIYHLSVYCQDPQNQCLAPSPKFLFHQFPINRINLPAQAVQGEVFPDVGAGVGSQVRR